MSDLEEKLKLYREGFKDGFEAGLKAAKPVPLPTEFVTTIDCSVCGKVGINPIYTFCGRPDCPGSNTFFTPTCSPKFGI